MLARFQQRRWGRRLVAATATVALVGTAAVSAAGASAGSKQKIVKIGVIAPLTAGLTSYGKGIENSVRLAVKEANADEAIPGWKIVVAAKNDSSEPAVGKKAAQKLAKDPAVIGVVGTYNSGVAAETAPVLEKAGIVQISPGNTDPTLTLGEHLADDPQRQFTNYFRVVASDAQQGVVLADYAAADLGATSVAVVSETKSVSKGLADRFSAEFEDKGGQVVYTKTVPDGTTDFTTVASEIAPLNPSLIFFGGEYEVAAALSNATAAVSAPLMGGDGIKDDAYIQAAGANAEGDIASSIGAPIDQLAAAADYEAAYEAAGYDDPPSVFGPYAYDSANIIIDAAAKALKGKSAVNKKARASVVKSVQATDTEGITGRIAFDDYGDTVTKVFTIYQVTDGQWVPVKTVEAT
jgi:branched-chain amino acid transport system substrate-binding protein